MQSLLYEVPGIVPPTAPSLMRPAQGVAREREREGAHLRGHGRVRLARDQLRPLFTVERLVQVVVRRDGDALEREAGEESLTARVGEDARAQARVRRSARRAPHGAGGRLGLAADLKLILHQTAERVAVHEEQHVVGLRRADLRAEAPARKVVEDGRAPLTLLRAAADDAIPFT